VKSDFEVLLWRRFSRQLPPDDDLDWRDVLGRAGLDEDASRGEPRRPQRRQSHWRPPLVAGLVAGVLAACASLLVVSPWRGGSAEAATIQRRAAALLGYRAGLIEYRKVRETYTFFARGKGAAKARTEVVSSESWSETAAPFRSRRLVSYDGHTLESGAGGNGCHSPRYVFDPASGTLYRSRYTGVCVGSPRPVGPAAQVRDELAAGALEPAGTTTIAGRTVYRFRMPDSYYDKRLRATIVRDSTNAFLYVDARDYRTVRVVWTSTSAGYRDRLDYLDWTYLPASATNRALSDIRAQHPTAPLRPLAAMPRDVTRQLLQTIGEARAPRARR
jgi:hypothetical protein